MYSQLKKIKINESIVFQDLGELVDFNEQHFEYPTLSWPEAFESYELLPVENMTRLIVKVDTFTSYLPFMKTSFPLALTVLKKIAENNMQWRC